MVTGAANRAVSYPIDKTIGYALQQGVKRTRDDAAGLLTQKGDHARKLAEQIVDLNSRRGSRKISSELAQSLLMGPAVTQSRELDIRKLRREARQ